MKRWSLVLALILGTSTLLTTGFTAPQKPISPPEAVLAQEDGGVTVDTARPVTEIVGEKTAYLATVSPDGKYIAWGKQSGKRKESCSAALPVRVRDGSQDSAPICRRTSSTAIPISSSGRPTAATSPSARIRSSWPARATSGFSTARMARSRT